MNQIASNRRPPSRRTQRGVGLVEVLIAVVVLAFGLLGIAAMQLTALRNSQSALERSQAVAQTYAILDAMRANDDLAVQGRYNIPETCAVPDAGDIVANDLHHWMETMQRVDVLGPRACGTITCGARECKIKVSWDDTRAGGSDKEFVETTTQL
ncbi:type IV pilus modification protein PilV [Noviluteimonas gilva]|uniref:Type IV pilus modification protein PilV n=1 Tax=Noviluteimonas gilva TaxID=2682097 RepID=A0A7C9HSS2_9GAMM|nr:type IV pilus modification protein PilV [Lysobacter gilvus]MUV14413.1 type IV pilus modification protein PilV [Lysobacter gilvus]